MVPYDCDALLPLEERYASLKFRRLSRRIVPRYVDWADAVELVAWMQTLGGVKYAREIMMWPNSSMDYVRRLYEAPEFVEAAAPLLAENQRLVTAEDGFKLLHMISKGRPIPELVRMALAEERHALKLSMRAQAEKHGLDEWQVQYRLRVGRSKPLRDDRLAGLSFG